MERTIGSESSVAGSLVRYFSRCCVAQKNEATHMMSCFMALAFTSFLTSDSAESKKVVKETVMESNGVSKLAELR